MSLIENHKRFVDGFTKFLGAENILESKIPRERRVFITIKREKLRDAVKYLMDHEGFNHITTITGLDAGETLDVLYHLTKKDLSLTLRVKAPMDDPAVDSISDLMNGAFMYELEVHDLIGVVPRGHPNLKRLSLPEDWPEGVHPLLKKWSLDKIKEEINGKEG